MAKRGETRPWKVAYKWANGVKGLDSYTTQDGADLAAKAIRRAGEQRGEAVEVAVYTIGTHDLPNGVTAIAPTLEPLSSGDVAKLERLAEEFRAEIDAEGHEDA